MDPGATVPSGAGATAAVLWAQLARVATHTALPCLSSFIYNSAQLPLLAASVSVRCAARANTMVCVVLRIVSIALSIVIRFMLPKFLLLSMCLV